MRDCWLSKLLFDLQNPQAAGEFRDDQEAFLGEYPLEKSVLAAIRGNDVTFLAARVNPYLPRYCFFTTGMKDAEFIQRLRDG